MNLPRWIQALQDIRTHCQYNVDDTAGFSRENFSENRPIRQAVERNLTIIGISAGQVREDNPDVFDASEELRYSVGLRNRLAHGYGDLIDEDIIWETIQISIPKLLAEASFRLGPY